jgi:hypothetical protein
MAGTWTDVLMPTIVVIAMAFEWQGYSQFLHCIIYLLLSNGKFVDCLCGLVARVPGYKSRGPLFDSRRY